MFTLILIASHCFLIKPVIDLRTLPPLSLISNRHSIWSTHTLSPLNCDCSRVTTLCTPSSIMSPMSLHSFPPQLLCLPWLHTLSSLMMISPMDPHYAPFNDYGYLLMKSKWWGNLLCTKVLMPWLEYYCLLHIIIVRIRRYITTLAP